MRTRAGLLIFLAACGGSPEGEEPPEQTLKPPQADRPLLSTDATSLAERFRLDDLRLELPRDLDIDAQGNLYVLDFAAPTQLLKYDSTGQFLRRFADRDEDTDKERLVSAIEFALAPWNTVLVVDRGQNTLQTFLATTGTFATSVEVRPAIALDVQPLPGFGEFYLKKWDPGQRRSVVLHMRAPYDSLATAYELRLPPGLTVREEARGVHYNTAVDREGRLYVAFYDGYPVRVLAPDGQTVRLVNLARQPVLRSPAEIAREAEANLATLRERAPGIDEALLEEAARPDSIRPLIEELSVDPTDRLWVRTNRPDAAGVTPYDVFNEAGDYLARIDVPGIVERTAFDPQGRLYVIASSAPGARREIIGYDVQLGGTATP
jgi:hypothetical protein